MPDDGIARRLEWRPRARSAYFSTLERIAEQDPFTARQFELRVEHALAIIQTYPRAGTPGARPGERRYPIPGTGHVLNYRVTRSTIRIHLWYRARQAIGL